MTMGISLDLSSSDDIKISRDQGWLCPKISMPRCSDLDDGNCTNY